MLLCPGGLESTAITVSQGQDKGRTCLGQESGLGRYWSPHWYHFCGPMLIGFAFYLVRAGCARSYEQQNHLIIVTNKALREQGVPHGPKNMKATGMRRAQLVLLVTRVS